MHYSQFRAMLAITKGSLRSITRSPSAVVFSFIFPFIFILVFGFIGDNAGVPTYKIVLDPSADTNNILYTALKQSPGIRIINYNTNEEMQSDLIKGRIAGVINIYKQTEANQPAYLISLKSTTASSDKWPQLKSLLTNLNNEVSDKMFPGRQRMATFDFNPERDIQTVREYKTIDFILPGQLGFSLLSAGVFGVAFMFFNLRNTLVLKRFFATPIHRTYIILGEGLSRVIFQLVTAVVILLVGHFLFGFTLVNGFQTFFDMLLLSFIALVIFMGFGFIISGLAKSDSTIPPLANIITLPQFLMGGTFFSIDAFPKWLQPVSKAMPLTHLNEAFRKIAFEGQSLWQVKTEVGILLLWGIAAYVVAVKVFKWE